MTPEQRLLDAIGPILARMTNDEIKAATKKTRKILAARRKKKGSPHAS